MLEVITINNNNIIIYKDFNSFINNVNNKN